MWLTKLKIAIASQDIESLQKLLDTPPKLSTKAELKEAQYLLAEAIALVSTLRDETKVSMNQIKKNINFLDSTQLQDGAKLDIKS